MDWLPCHPVSAVLSRPLCIGHWKCLREEQQGRHFISHRCIAMSENNSRSVDRAYSGKQSPWTGWLIDWLVIGDRENFRMREGSVSLFISFVPLRGLCSKMTKTVWLCCGDYRPFTELEKHVSWTMIFSDTAACPSANCHLPYPQGLAPFGQPRRIGRLRPSGQRRTRQKSFE